MVVSIFVSDLGTILRRMEPLSWGCTTGFTVETDGQTVFFLVQRVKPLPNAGGPRSHQANLRLQSSMPTCQQQEVLLLCLPSSIWVNRCSPRRYWHYKEHPIYCCNSLLCFSQCGVKTNQSPTTSSWNSTNNRSHFVGGYSIKAYLFTPAQRLRDSLQVKMVSSEDIKIGVLLVIFILPFIIVIRQLFIETDDLRRRQDAEEAAAKKQE